MFQVAKHVSGAVLGVVMAITMANCNAGCSVVPAECRSEAAYRAALLDCVERSLSIEESQMCRHGVNVRCGISYP